MLKPLLHRLGRWLAGKTAPWSLGGTQWTGTGSVDSFKRVRNPTPNELMAELKATAWPCASINASVCAAYPPRLYVSTSRNQAEPKCAAKSISHEAENRLRAAPYLAGHTKSAQRIQEVVEHPL